ncbi:unnamed protein product [Peniophora sp. CBMAI 1063]|nr:unnamed protein product [Peniophora sp. CBMAI 1063]
MDLLYPEKKDAFDSLLANFTPSNLRSAPSLLLSSSRPASQMTSHIDADLTRLDEFSRALRTERNKCVHLLRLPVEVIGYIIELCARAEPPRPVQNPAGPVHQRPGSFPPGWLGWVRMGHICTFLRQVLLEMSALWATVPFTLSRGHTEIMARARDAPLVVDLRLNHSWSEFLLQSAEAHFSSARLIRIKGEFHRPSLSSLELGMKDFRALEELELSGWTMDQNVTRDTIDLPPIRAPRLRHLQLDNRFIPFNPSALQSLTLNYHESMPSSSGPKHFHGPAFLELLSRCTSLQRLSLGGMQIDELPTPSSARAPISLPRLKYIAMISNVAFCRSVWSNLILDPHICVKVTLISPYPQDDNVSEIQAVLADEDAFITTLLRRFSDPEAPSVTGVSLDFREQDLCLALAVSDVGAFTDEYQGPFKDDRAFALDVYSRRHDRGLRAALFERLLVDLPKQVDLSNIDALGLTLYRDNTITPAQWLELLAPYHSARDLVHDEFPPQHAFWAALCPPAEVPLALPNVRTLFALPEEPQSMYDFNSMASTLSERHVPWADIPAGLHRRASRGAAIERIVLGTYWDISKVVGAEGLQALRSAVQEVVDTRQYVNGYLVVPDFDD